MKTVKRVLDILAAFLALVLLMPFLLFLALLIKMKLGSPILFCQDRPGINGRVFRMYKFRSMTDTKDDTGNLLADSERLTPFGRKLRDSSLDELPELWNVLRGEMSIVGPRPLLVEYLPLYTNEQMRRHEVPPGITGWAQINGRNAISWEEKFRLDIWYVDNWSLWLDFKIIWATVRKTLVREGITSGDHATTTPFTGKVGK